MDLLDRLRRALRSGDHGKPETYTLRVTARDTAGTPLRATVRFGHASATTARETRLWDGSETLELESRVWTVRATHGGRELVEAVTLDAADNVTFVFEDRTVTIWVIDAQDGEPIPNADVVIETPNYHEIGTTDDEGVWHGDVPFAVDPIELTVDHEAYTRQTGEVSPDSDLVKGTVQLRPQTTAVELCVTTDGAREADVPITIVNQHSGATLEGTTDDGGTVRFEDIESGTYRVVPPEAEYTVASDKTFLHVSAGKVATVDIGLSRE